MIQGFEEHTANLKAEELEVAELVAEMLKGKIGIDKAITNKFIRNNLFYAGYDINGPKLRRIIQYIRANKLVKMLCASKKGYYIAEDQENWVRYKHAFRTRITSMQFTLECMQD